ncbi:MAG: helix-turn-helix transcriptional regulator [Oscillospiraceae bacterium]|nr:helix-turn-helix transcriptional regulator [Oscillospiraceae bacterium]
MAYHRLESVVDQHLTQDMANYQLSRSLVSVGYYVNVETRSSIAHSHPYYEFILVRRGICEYHSNGARFFLHPDEMLIISPGTVHTMLCKEDSSSYERLILQVDADFMARVIELCRYDEMPREVKPLLVLRADAVCRWGLRELFERINAAAAVKDAALRERLYLYQLAELMLTITHTLHADDTLTVNSSSALISDVTAYIQIHFRDPELNVARLAQQFYVSREHLSRTFRASTDESISHYLTDLRMQEFRYGLLMGKSVLNACLESGFSDYSSFVKSFRKLYGITPMEYREQLKNAMNRVPAESGADLPS